MPGRPTGPSGVARIAAIAGTTVFLAGAVAARRPEVGAREQRWFGRVNGLPPQWFPPAWPDG
jgi:hypothetical protein